MWPAIAECRERCTGDRGLVDREEGMREDPERFDERVDRHGHHKQTESLL